MKTTKVLPHGSFAIYGTYMFITFISFHVLWDIFVDTIWLLQCTTLLHGYHKLIITLIAFFL